MYELTIAAARGETASKWELGKALAIECPERTAGTNGRSEGGRWEFGDGPSVLDLLAEARQAIISAGGEPRSVASLKEYRLTAIWLGDRIPVEGCSFAAHNEARRTGMTFEAFADRPITSARIRDTESESIPSGLVEMLADLTSEQKDEVLHVLDAQRRNPNPNITGLRRGPNRSPLEAEKVYVMASPLMPGYVKIGRTNVTVEERAANNGAPLLETLAYWVVEDSRKVENELHLRFDDYRIHGTEYFRVSLRSVTRAIAEHLPRKRPT